MTRGRLEAVESACAATNHRINCASGWGIPLMGHLPYRSKALTLTITTDQEAAVEAESVKRVASSDYDL